MKAITISLSGKMNEMNYSEFENTNSMTKKEKTALKVIYRHAGKRFVYETYSRTQPEMAQKYLRFIAKYPWKLYIKWDKEKERFVA